VFTTDDHGQMLRGRPGCHTGVVPSLVSVVVPIFNGLPYLEAAVDSALAQSYPEIEVVLVDGGSTDGSREWVHTVDDPRVRTLEMPAGTTAAGNWTAACRAATGEYVKLLCQDDVLYPQGIAEQVADLEAHPQAGMAIAQRDIIDARGRVLYRSRGCTNLPVGLSDGRDAIRTSYQHGTNIFGEPVAVLFRGSALTAALPWDEQRPFILDLQLYQRVMLSAPIVVRKHAVGAFRVSGSSWSTRLVRTQTDQLRSWQREVEATLDPTRTQRALARVELSRQSVLRRAAYRFTKLRGAFAHAPHH
jgi:glycosyltransferase involved in cell wall biosynthesis